MPRCLTLQPRIESDPLLIKKGILWCTLRLVSAAVIHKLTETSGTQRDGPDGRAACDVGGRLVVVINGRVAIQVLVGHHDAVNRSPVASRRVSRISRHSDDHSPPCHTSCRHHSAPMVASPVFGAVGVLQCAVGKEKSAAGTPAEHGKLGLGASVECRQAANCRCVTECALVQSNAMTRFPRIREDVDNV